MGASIIAVICLESGNKHGQTIWKANKQRQRGARSPSHTKLAREARRQFMQLCQR